MVLDMQGRRDCRMVPVTAGTSAWEDGKRGQAELVAKHVYN